MSARPFIIIGLAAATLAAACARSTDPGPASAISGNCKLSQSAPQIIPSSQATTLHFDRAGACDIPRTNDSTLTLPRGTWIVLSQLSWSPNDQGQRGSCLFQNGVPVSEAGARPLSSAGTILTTATTIESDGSAIIRLTGTQTSGTMIRTMTLDPNTGSILTYLQATRIR